MSLRKVARIMKLSAHDLKQIDENTPSRLSHEQLIFFSLSLISDLKEARQLLKEQPKAATQHNKEEPKFDSILIDNHENIYFHDDIECRNYLELLQKYYKEHLLSCDLSQRTINKKLGIVSRFVDYICFDCDLKKMNDISVGMANSYFRKWHLTKIRDATEGQLKTVIGDFFLFLYNELNIRNERVVQSFKRK